jgi:hypothetical protein
MTTPAVSVFVNGLIYISIEKKGRGLSSLLIQSAAAAKKRRKMNNGSIEE